MGRMTGLDYNVSRWPRKRAIRFRARRHNQAEPADHCGAGSGGRVGAEEYIAQALSSGKLEMSCQNPDDPANWPRNLFVWRSNLLGSSGKGHEYFLKHLLGTTNGVLGKDLGTEGHNRPHDVDGMTRRRRANSTSW